MGPKMHWIVLEIRYGAESESFASEVGDITFQCFHIPIYGGEVIWSITFG